MTPLAYNAHYPTYYQGASNEGLSDRVDWPRGDADRSHVDYMGYGLTLRGQPYGVTVTRSALRRVTGKKGATGPPNERNTQ